MRWLLTVLLVLATHLEARPCSRAQSPFETAPVAVAADDVIVLVEAVSVTGSVATVKVVRHISGVALTKETFQVHGLRTSAETPLRDFCGIRTIDPGFKPRTSLKVVRTVTFVSQSLRLSPIMNTAIVPSTTAAKTNSPTSSVRRFLTRSRVARRRPPPPAPCRR